jgi:flagellar basal body-associated protein FliL
MTNLKADVKEIKGTQKAQIWTLIVAIITAFLGILAALGRWIFLSTNP